MRTHRVALVSLSLCLALVACMKQKLEPGDREMLLTIGELRAYGLELPEGFEAWETFSRERWFDGSVLLEYEFEAPAELDLPYLSSMAERHRSKSDACFSYRAGNVGMRFGGLELDDDPGDFRYGDESHFTVLEDEAGPYGNYFAMCRGRTTFWALLVGFYFDGEGFAGLVGEALAALAGAP